MRDGIRSSSTSPTLLAALMVGDATPEANINAHFSQTKCCLSLLNVETNHTFLQLSQVPTTLKRFACKFMRTAVSGVSTSPIVFILRRSFPRSSSFSFPSRRRKKPKKHRRVHKLKAKLPLVIHSSIFVDARCSYKRFWRRVQMFSVARTF